MPEFTLKLRDEEVVRSFVARLDEVLKGTESLQVFGSATFDGEHLTVDINSQFPRITVYLGVFMFVAGGFSMLAFGLGPWTLVPAVILTIMSIVGSSYWWAYVWVIPRLRKRGYRGRIKLVHAEGLF